MNLEDKFNIVRSVGEHCDVDDELSQLIANKDEPVCLDGFKPSGRIHIAQGLMRIINAKKLIKAGCNLRIVIADDSAFLNNNFGGDKEKIRTVGLYYIELLKAAGLDAHVEFLWSSDQRNSKPDEYWTLVMGIAQRFKLPRLMSCVDPMGFNKQQIEDEFMTGNLLNICMQCADIFFLKADICQMGLDQQTLGLLAREYADVVGEIKPIILSHHLLPGLKQGQEKMSKSNESSCMFMDDSEAEVNAKIKKAYCPPSAVQGNPLIDYIKCIILPWDGEFKVERSAENGGEKIFKRIEDLISDYEKGGLHPADLKTSLSKALNKILLPIQDHFNNDSFAKNLWTKVKKLTQTNTHSSHPMTKNQRSAQLESEANQNSIKTSVFCDLKRVHKGNITNTYNSCETVKDLQSLQLNQFFSNSSKSSLKMSLEKKFHMVRSIGEECIQDDELHKLLSDKHEPVCYDGFEPSGKMHIAQGVMKMINVNKLIAANCKVKIWIADWFAQLNHKMGGDLGKIQTVGQYMIEIWKALGLNVQGDKVEFLWASKEINSRADEYWSLVMDIARRKTLSRIKRCVQIMGRSEQDELTAAQFLYPCMQCADVFFLKADICQLGMDQRKVNVLAREYCVDIKRKKKPIILSHHILPGLKRGQEKMSKSDPSSSIYMDDKKDITNKKIEEAYCPPCLVDGNPCFEYIKYLIFPQLHELKVIRNADQGGEKTFSSFEEVVEDYESGKLLPIDLKSALSKALDEILQPVKDHFKNNAAAKKLQEAVEGFAITR